ncbi:N-acetylneuraminate synthase family protein [Pelagibacterales bacterium SAG-MED19]|nr:N-acetylneuraminate synthase family protein [Pelagibacterales bacterium SAG-MED19]
MKKFKLGKFTVGNDHPPIVIVELGINHNGNLDLAINMTDRAIDAGAEIIKHQTHIVDDEMSIEAKKIIPGNSKKNIFDIIKSTCLDEKDEKKLMNHIRSRKKIFISTPFSRAAADRLGKFNIPAFKIGSGECNNHYLVDYICKFKKPIIMSTGMNSIKSISKSVSIIRKHKLPFVLMHCTNIYPTAFNLVRLNCLEELKKAYPDAILGLSDHTSSINTCLGAVSLGARVLEKHFVDDRSKRKGPDISASMDTNELKELIRGSNQIFKALGNGKGPIKEEKKTISFAFQSVVSTKKILRGEKLTKKNIFLRRPGSGDFLVNDYKKLLGKKVKRNIRKNVQIRKKDI